MLHWRNRSNSRSPEREYCSGEWAEGHSRTGSSEDWIGLDYGDDRSETGFREDLAPYSRESEGDPHMYDLPRIYYEDEGYPPISSSLTDQAFYRVDDFHTGETEPGQGPWYRPENYEVSPDFLTDGRLGLETQEELQGWRYKERSDTHSFRSHSVSPLNDRSTESYSQCSLDWIPRDCRERRSSYDEEQLYKDRRHDPQSGGRKRSPPFRESIHPHKRPRSLDLQDRYTDPGSQPSMKWSSSSSLCSDGDWSEPDRRRGWAAYSRDPSPDWRESGTSSAGCGQRHRSPPRGERSSLGHTRRGDDPGTYSTRRERRKEVTGEELQSRAVHRHSLSPHSDSLKYVAPSRLRGSHHRSLSPHAEYPGGVAPKDRAHAGDLRHLLLKRGHSRSVEKPPATDRDHRPRFNTSISSEREFASSCGHLSERSRQSITLSDDVSSLRRDRKGSKRQKNEGIQASLSPRSKSRSTDGYGSEGNRTIQHRGEKDDERGSSPRKGGKPGDPTGALDCGDSLTERKNKGRKRVSEQRDCGRKEDSNVKDTGSTCKAVNSATVAQESPAHSRQSITGPSLHSTGESKLFLDGRPEGSAVTTPDTCAVSYGYTVTMEKRSTVGKTNSARESVEASRDPRLLSKTEAKPSLGRTDSERARTEASAAVADSLAPEDGGGGTARDGRGDTPSLNALPGISWIIKSPSAECGDHRPAGAVEMSEAVATPDPEATPGLPFGYSKKWNADAHKVVVTSQSKPDDDNMATLESALDRERLEGQPTGRVDSGSGGLQELLDRGDSCGTADLRGSTPVRRAATSERSQRYSPSSPTTDCESWEPEIEGLMIGCVIPQPTFETAPGEAEANLPGASGGTSESSNHRNEVEGAGEAHSKHSSHVAHVSGVQGSWTTAGSGAHPCRARGGEIQNASHHSVDIKSTDHNKTSDDCATGDSRGHVEPTLDSCSTPSSLTSDQSAALVASSADQPRVTGAERTAGEERGHAGHNGEEAEEREERTDGTTSCRGVQGTTATKRLRIMNIRRKKDELEEVYRRECLAFIQVAKMMVRHDSTLESHLVQSVRGNLLQMGQRCVQELEKFVRLEMSKE